MSRLIGDAQIEALIKSGGTASPCLCGYSGHPEMRYCEAMTPRYRYLVECRDCARGSWGGSAKTALARWNRREFIE